MHVPSFRRKKKWKYNTTYKDNKQRESKKENKFRLKLKKVGKTTRPFKYDLNQIPYDYTVEVTNRFKELNLIDRVPDELWTMEVRDIVQEAVIKTILKKKKCKNTKWLYEEAVKIAEERREVKSKGEKEGYTHLNAVSKNSKEKNESLPQ